MKPHLCTFLNLVVSMQLMGCGILNTSIGDASSPKMSIPEEFFYHTSGRCDDGTLTFVSLLGGGIMLWSDPDQVVVGQGDLYLSADSTFILHYEEFTPDTKVFDKKISGKFDFNNQTGDISLENIGTARVTTYNGRAVLELKFTNIINEPAIENKKVIFHVGRTRDGLDVTGPEYCNYK